MLIQRLASCCCRCRSSSLFPFIRRFPLGLALQEMLAGPKTFLDQGVVRNVSMVEYHGKTLVVKTLLPQDKPSHHQKHLEMHQLEVLTLDAVNVLALCPRKIRRFLSYTC